MNNFIVTSQGFLKDVVYSIEENKKVFSYTNKIREAKRFNSKTAKN